MGKNYSREALEQLRFGRGRVLTGEGALIVLKALLESGVSYLGGYPGAPTSTLYDAIADAYDAILRPMGIYVEGSGNEAAAAALLATSIHYPMRGAVNWKVVGSNVAADALAHVAHSGVLGGALTFVGEDYGCNSTIIAEKTLPYAQKSTLAVIDPPGDPQAMVRLVKAAFALSEHSHLPVLYLLRTRTGNLKGSIACEDNVEPRISMRHPMPGPAVDMTRVTLPPYTFVQERMKFEARLPAARAFVRAHALNGRHPGEGRGVGIITHGMLYNTTLRALRSLGEADLFGRTWIDILNLTVLHPLVPEEIAEFLRDKQTVLIVEEGMPNTLEQEIRAVAQAEGLAVRLHGKDLLPMPGEYTPEVLIRGLGAFLARRVYPADGKRAEVEGRVRGVLGHVARARGFLKDPLAARGPVFCTGCPERPVFSALKIMQQAHERPHYAGDIGCYSMGGLPPFGMSDTITGMGTGLATSGALQRMSEKPVISFMGDGTFWHSGLTTSIANAVYNRQEAVMVIFENFWTSMTGQQENPASGKNVRGEPTGEMSIQGVLRAMGVRWVKEVNPYDLKASMAAMREAVEAKGRGLRVVVSHAECQLERQRRVRAEKKEQLRRGEQVVEVKLGVDDEVCVGDHSCMRLNGCPSLTTKPGPNPLREDPIATIVDSCVGCGLCGEIAHAAVLCPSFYEVRVVRNPGLLARLAFALSRALAGGLLRVAL